ncbi:MAG: hypothetical protein ISS78_06455 [Phycisphaerae bacterium]|nr:hypothetical protein [Phycisphaerae bacterium]
MKNPKTYEQRIRKIIARAGKAGVAKRDAGADADAGAGEDPFTVLIEGVLQADVVGTNTDKAMAALRKEFVDFNELRVAPVKELAHCLGPRMPHAREKAHMLSTALNAVFYQQERMSMDYMGKMKRRPLRRYLSELGLNAYAAGYVILMAFNMPSLPVDDNLLESLKMNGDLPKELGIEEAQRFLERTVRAWDMPGVHKCFRAYVVKNAAALASKRRTEARARAKAEAEAKAKREAKAKAQAEAEAKAKERARAKTSRARKVARKAARRRKKAGATAARKRRPSRAAKKTRTQARAARKKKK